MKVEPIFPDVSTALARAGPVERQGSRGAEERRSGGAEGRGLLSTPAPQHLRTEGTSPTPGKGKEEIRPEEAVVPVVNGLHVKLEFVQDEATGQRVIRLYDRESGDLIRQIPPEEVLAFLRQIAKGKGVLVSRRL